MIDIEGADRYFSESSMFDNWREYSAEQRKRAIQGAKRDLSRALGRAVDENEPPYELGDKTRDEFAVYEQAIYMLTRDVMPSGNGSAVPSLNPDEAKTPRQTMSKGTGVYSALALAWLGEIRAPKIALG